MPSPFFTRLGQALEGAGCRVTGINLCPGDRIFWQGGHRVDYRGKYSDWPNFFARFIDANDVTDVVLLGEQRRYHKEAVKIAQARGVRVTVTDFGYLRPDWITLEQDGMSGNSRFPKNSKIIQEKAKALPEVCFDPLYADNSTKMAVGDVIYLLSNMLLWWLYPHYRQSDMRPHPLIYWPASAKRMFTSWLRRKETADRLNSIMASGQRLFVFPLQLEHDFQIVAYSPFNSLNEAIELVIESFARNSAGDTRLVIKIHPWDAGLQNWEKLISECARRFQMEERVDYLDGGNLDALTKVCCGMVTVNSTSGVRALQLGKPVKLLGKAIYDVPGLVFQGSLDRFWREAESPDPDLINDFFKLLVHEVQIRGVFFMEPGLSSAVSEAKQRLLRCG